MFIASWLVFVVDLVVHERRTIHYLRTWMGRFDLTVVVLTAPWFIVLGPSESRFVLIIRLARLARVVMATRGARKLFERLGRVALCRGAGRVRGRRGRLPRRARDQPGVQDLRRRAVVVDRDPHDGRLRRHRADDHGGAHRRRDDHDHRHLGARAPRGLDGELLPPRPQRCDAHAAAGSTGTGSVAAPPARPRHARQCAATVRRRVRGSPPRSRRCARRSRGSPTRSRSRLAPPAPPAGGA